MIKFWLNGRMYKKEEAAVKLESGALHYGLAVFEGIITVGIKERGKRQIVLFRASEHIDRLLSSADILGLSVKYSHNDIIMAIKDVITSNGWRSYYVRPLVYSQDNYLRLTRRNIPSILAVLIKPFNFQVFSIRMRIPISLLCFEGMSNPFKGKYASLKASGRYLINAVAKRHADLSGYDEAVLLDQNGHVSETTAANIFLIKDNKIYTPPLGNIIGGITRKTAIDILYAMGIMVGERDISKGELLGSDAIFITGTAAGIVAVRQICHRRLDVTHRILAELQNRYLNIISAKDKEFSNHISYV